MGNLMSDLVVGFSSWSPLSQWTFSIVGSSIFVYCFVKFLINKPFGVQRQYAQAIEANDKRRAAVFFSFRDFIDVQRLLDNSRIRLPSKKGGIGADKQTVLADLSSIAKLSLFALRDKLQRDELNAVTALCAYVYAAIDANEKTNAITEFIREAMEYAVAADDKWSGKSTKPPLYGIPFSVKSNFYMKGYDCTIGVAKLLDDPKDTDCPFVTHLRNLGAVPFAITNVPQGLLSFVCSNSVYGTTKNPLNPDRSPGGSSGGEAALLAAGGSAFGIGSDLAGSLRIPASMCGLTSLKPTQDRFVVTNTHGGVPGRGRLGLSFGFFTKNVNEQIFLLEQIVGSDTYRKLVPQSPPAPLRLDVIDPDKKLRIGYFDADGFCPPVPSHRRAVVDTAEFLKAQGHQLIKFEVPDVQNAARLLYKNLMPDNGEYMRMVYANERIDTHMSQFVTLLKVPRVVRWLASRLLGLISPQMALISGSYMTDMGNIRETQSDTDDYRLDFIKYWKSLEIDVLLCPAFIVPAVEHKFPEKLSTGAFATGLFNMLDLPAGVVPAGTVTTQDDIDVLNESVFSVGSNPILKAQRDAAVNSVGLPNSVQLVALPFEEEICLHAMRLVEEVWTSKMDI